MRVLELGNFNINFNQDDCTCCGKRTRRAARHGAALPSPTDVAKAKQVQLDQKFGNDARYVQQLAGNWNNYAAGCAMMGAGEGMAKGGGDGGGAGMLGAQVAVGMGMMNAMQSPSAGAAVHSAPASSPLRSPPAPTAAGGKVSLPEVQRVGACRQVLLRVRCGRLQQPPRRSSARLRRRDWRGEVLR